MSAETSHDPSDGPVCPNCRKPLRANLRYERMDARRSSDGEIVSRATVLFCGSCGLSLDVEPVPIAGGIARATVETLRDESTVDGLFQLRCRDLIGEIGELGFDPHVWVDMINDLGAVSAAKRILENRIPLVATKWLVERERSDLTMEQEINQLRWADLFNDDERAEAKRRLSVAQGQSP